MRPADGASMLDNLLDESMPKELWDLSKSMYGQVSETSMESRIWAPPANIEENTNSKDNNTENNANNSNEKNKKEHSSVDNVVRPPMEGNINALLNPNRRIGRNSQRTNSGSSSSSSSGNSTECAYCRTIQFPYIGHTKKNCPVLASLDPCNTCGAWGKRNHTASHCPNQRKTLLKLKPEYEERWKRRQQERRDSN